MAGWPLISAFLLIGAAELGDKTQLLTLGFAARYPFRQVISAVFCATAVLMAIAVIFGGLISRLAPEFFLQLFAGLLFLYFGLSTLREKEAPDKLKANNNNHLPFFIVFTAIFLAEIGDKTQLATFALAAGTGAPFQVWLGATLGMVLINAIAALAGQWLKKHLPEEKVKFFGAALFIIFGLITLLRVFAPCLPAGRS